MYMYFIKRFLKSIITIKIPYDNTFEGGVKQCSTIESFHHVLLIICFWGQRLT